MLLLLLRFTGAASADDGTPDGEDLVARASRGVRSPPGCWILRGTADDTWDVGILGKGRRSWALSGTLRDGVWEGLTSTVTAGDPVDEDERKLSLFGRDPVMEARAKEKGRSESVSILEVLQDDVTMETVEPYAGGWRLIRTLKGGDAGRNLLDLRYDGALRPYAWSVLIVDPVQLKTQRGTKGKIVAMDARLEASPDGAPRSEAMDGTFAMWPFTARVTTRVRWESSPCPTASPAEAGPAIVPAPQDSGETGGAAP